MPRGASTALTTRPYPDRRPVGGGAPALVGGGTMEGGIQQSTPLNVYHHRDLHPKKEVRGPHSGDPLLPACGWSGWWGLPSAGPDPRAAPMKRDGA